MPSANSCEMPPWPPPRVFLVAERLVAVVVITILAGVVAKDARASAVVGEYSVYFGIPAILIYYFAKNRVGAAAPVSRRPQPRRPVRRG